MQSPTQLNSAQQTAVDTLNGPVLVLAGAGTGKTRVVTERIANLLRHNVPAHNILGVTFTNKAAAEMKSRLTSLLGFNARNTLRQLQLSTFHSLGVLIMRRHAEVFGFRNNFTIVAAGEQLSMIRKASRTVAGLTKSKPEALTETISRMKNAGLTPLEANRQAVEDHEFAIASVYRRYQDALQAQNAFDFDDLLLYPLKLFERYPQQASEWQQRFQYILIDEFQDVNEVQHRLIQLLAAPQNNICVVGDDDQSIYSWRGAISGNIVRFTQVYPQCKSIRLEENYRSTNAILKAANAVIVNNNGRVEKQLWSALGEGLLISTLIAEDADDEASRIAASIARRLRNKEAQSADFAVLVRTVAQMRPFEDAFKAEQIPYVLVGGQSFYDRKESRDVAGYLSVIVNPQDDQALLRIINTPARGIGDATVKKLADYAQKIRKPIATILSQTTAIGIDKKAAASCSDLAKFLDKWRVIAKADPFTLVRTVLDDICYEEEVNHLYNTPLEQMSRLNVAYEMSTALKRHLLRDSDNNIVDFVRNCLLDKDSDNDKNDPNTTGVRIITVHSAKGLEYPIVYIAGCEEGMFPHKNAETPLAVEEERRLFYVAMTRARQQLTLSRCAARESRLKTKPCPASRFINEIPQELLDRSQEHRFTQSAAEKVEEIRRRINATFGQSG